MMSAGGCPHGDPEVAVIALPAERGSAWTLMYPRFSVVVPEPDIAKVPWHSRSPGMTWRSPVS
jgi:hypothetical protein